MGMSPEQRQRYLETMGIQCWVPRAVPDAPVASGAVPVASVASQAPTSIAEVAAGDVLELDWEELAARVAACTRCGELAAKRTQTVFGVGDRQADWLFIGEAPGAEEDRQGEPFVGRAGQLLDSMLFALGLKRGQGVYIANILKCRPPGNRDPKPEEARACRAYLDRQIDLIQPRIIVALGRIAAQNLLGTDEPLGRLRGKPLNYRDIPLVITYHPAYLLRQPADKRKAWEDLCLARRVMGV
jgi:DNA polymerase